jgi:hypothetical protein
VWHPIVYQWHEQIKSKCLTKTILIREYSLSNWAIPLIGIIYRVLRIFILQYFISFFFLKQQQ